MEISRDTDRLCGLLGKAAEQLATIEGPIWSAYESGAKIAEFVLECQRAIERDTITLSQKRELWRIFVPTCDWDDVFGDLLLGEEVYVLINRLYGEEIKTAIDQASK